MTETENADLPPIPLWTDDALESESEDRLDRKQFVDMVADRINACAPDQKSTVFGLVGPWGSGKTSLIKFILNRLRGNWKVAFFSPWASDNSAALQYEFLSALTSLLDEGDEKQRKAKESLRKYASVCAPLLGAIPVAGNAAAGAAAKVLELTNIPWHKQFEEVSEKLASVGARVLLVADDIDRLDADELLALLKVVRLLGRFPNVHYLMAYDQATVERLLESHGLGSRSTAFMEKIVQYPFEVPPIAGVIQRGLLVDTIIKFIDVHKIHLKDPQGERFSDFISVLAPAPVTPRAHTRFGEQLLAFGGMLNFNEIDVVDFAALSFLRVFHHNIYDRIPAWKSSLQSGKELLGSIDSSEINDAAWIARIRPLVNHDDDAVLVKHVLAGLFGGIKSNLFYAKDHDLALSDDTYFQRYFILGVAEDDVEDQLVQSAIRNIMVGDSTHSDVQRYLDIFEGSDNQLAALAYEKSQKFRSGELNASSNIVKFLFDRLKSRPDGTPSFDSAQNVLWRWVEAEVFKALTESKLTVSEILDSLAPRDVLGLVVRILRNRSRTEESSVKVLEGFLGHYRGLLMNDLEGLLDSGLDFNQVASVITFLSKGDSYHEFGDSLLSSGDLQLMDRVVRAMVTVNRWGGSRDDELVFNSETLTRLFQTDAIIQLAGHLPVAPPVTWIHKHDLSQENQGYLAYASVKSIAGMLSS